MTFLVLMIYMFIDHIFIDCVFNEHCKEVVKLVFVVLIIQYTNKIEERKKLLPFFVDPIVHTSSESHRLLMQCLCQLQIMKTSLCLYALIRC